MKKTIALAVSLLIMCVIFFFSAQPGDASSELSNEVAIDLEGSIFESIVPAVFSEDMNANIRKWAHVLVYFALGVSMTVTVFSFDENEERAIPQCGICTVIASLICLLYATSDEVHQLFVPGRAGMLADVFLDMAGALPGVLLITSREARKTKNRNSK